MIEEICFLISMLFGEDDFQRIALKVKQDQLQNDCDTHPMEPENREQLFNLLPPELTQGGKIVLVEHILDVHDITVKS